MATKNKSHCSENGSQCQNGGVCIFSTASDGTPQNYCKCPAGTSGNICHGVGVCHLECQHDSSCRHNDDKSDKDGFYCECAPGSNYKGVLCGIPYTVCPKFYEDEDAVTCLNGGLCDLRKKDHYGAPAEVYCKCPKGRSGDQCQDGNTSSIKDYNGSCVHDSDCKNDGVCIHKHDAVETEKTGMDTKFTYCQCQVGFGGDNCEKKCELLKCQNGSSCRFRDKVIDKDKAYTEDGSYCDCANTGQSGKSYGKYKGLECEIKVEKCPSDGLECYNGGTCVVNVSEENGDSYGCSCPSTHEGVHCEIQSVKNGSSNTGATSTGANGSSMISNDVVAKMQDALSEKDMIITGILIGFFCVVAIILGYIMRKRRKRRKAMETQRAVETQLDEGSFATSANDDNDTVAYDVGVGDANSPSSAYKSEGISEDGDIVNVDLNDDGPPNQKTQIV